MKTRSENWHVRAASLRTFQAIVSAVGDPFLGLIPESISFLAEVMEDEVSAVERESKKCLKQLELLSGEKLDRYLE